MRSIIATEVPISRASPQVEIPAASASVANVCRRWYGPRRSIAAASRASYHSRVRQVSSPMSPPFYAGNWIGVSTRAGSRSSAGSALAVSGTLRRERAVFGSGVMTPSATRLLHGNRLDRLVDVAPFEPDPLGGAQARLGGEDDERPYAGPSSSASTSISSRMDGCSSAERGCGLRPASTAGFERM